MTEELIKSVWVLDESKATDFEIKWIEALRSGNYNQTTGSWHHGRTELCCLSVAMEISEDVEYSAGSDVYIPKAYPHDAGNYEAIVRSLAPLFNIDEYKRITVNEGKDSFERMLNSVNYFIEMNDTMHKTFIEIADEAVSTINARTEKPIWPVAKTSTASDSLSDSKEEL